MMDQIGMCMTPNGFVGDAAFLFDEDQCPVSFHRMNSCEILYQPRRKKPKLLSKYLMGEKLGEGAYSVVKEALDMETLQRRAVKIMKLMRLRRLTRGEDNAQKEIRVHKRLRHENVVKLIDVFYIAEKQKFYMILEYCPVMLKDVLDSVPTLRLPIFQAAEYFHQLMNGLEYLHGQGIIHCDIKPGNLMVDNSGIIKIIDFGVCEELDRFRQDDVCENSQGTPTFQPPEVACLKSETIYGSKLDVWSSGVTLYNITTGQYPFSGENIYRLFENIVKSDFTFPDHLEDELLRDLIRKMLDKDPIQRLSVDQIKKHGWLQMKHPQNCDAVPIPPKNNNYDDAARSTTVLPYLKVLYDPSPSPSLSETDADEVPTDPDHNQSGMGDVNGLMSDLHISVASNANDTDGPNSRCRSSRKASFLNCLGATRSSCKQS